MLRQALAAAATFAVATVASADPLIYDGFAYTAGANVTTQNGGTGAWTAGWTNQGTLGGTVADAGLSSGSLAVTGNAWQDADSNTRYSERAFNNSTIGANNTSAWFSFLVNIPSVNNNTVFVTFGANSNGYSNSGFGVQFTDNTGVVNARIGGNSGTASAGGTISANGTTYLLVGRVDFKAGNDDLRLWLNPTLGGADPSNASAIATNLGAAGVTLGNFVAVRGGGGTRAIVDELRLGATFADVTPVPEPASLALLAAGGVLAATRRRG